MIACINLSKPRLLIEDKVDELIFDRKMEGYKIDKKTVQTAFSISLFIALTVIGHPVYAAAEKGWAMKAFKPIIDMLADLAEPIMYLVETGGALTLFFDRRKGIKMMKDGAIAYLIIQFLPVIIGGIRSVR